MQHTTAGTPEKKPGAQWFGALAALRANIVAGFRHALFLPVNGDDFRGGVNQAVFGLLTLVVVLTLLEFAGALPVPEFNRFGIGYQATGILAMLLALWLVAATQRVPQAFVRLVVMMSAALVTFSAVTFVARFALEQGFEGMRFWIASWALFLTAVLWELAIVIRVFLNALDLSLRRSAALSLLYLPVALAPVLGLPNQPLWYEGAPTEDVAAAKPDYRPIDVESTFYAQRPMMDAVLSDIGPGRPGVTDLYFVGFAGFGGQDVFMKEVDAAQSLFDGRFDTRHRSVALINNRATVDDVPLANGSNLRLALAGLAERMNRDEDVLFLFLTSHGSPGRLSTSFWPLKQNPITPDNLRAMLDDAGIRWRVVVVSACYSGSFVEALESDESLVITAARKDRTSFGCSDEAEFTYFGRALIDEALRNTRSFVEAFGMASAAVAEREAAEDFTPSEPQIFIGRHIRAKLGELESRLRDMGNVAAGG